MSDSAFVIDGFGPLAVERPTSVDSLGDLVRRASTADQALYPFGGGGPSQGRIPTRAGVAVDLRGLDQVIDFPARDMTVTVQAGIAVGKLQAMLAPENLRLPIDVPRSSETTLGGAIAANLSGPRRLGFGTLRDYVIGISAVNDVGAEFKAGGRVVKNVAGYDLCKLLVGSFGTLGIVTQATLKLRPLAEEQALLSIPCATAQLGDLCAKIAGSRTRPVIADSLDRTAAETVFRRAQATPPSADWVVVVGYEGNADAVNWQVQHLVKELGPAFPIEARVGYTSHALGDALVEWAADVALPLTIKASVPVSAGPAIAALAASFGGDPRVRLHAGNGVFCVHLSPASVDAAQTVVARWRAEVGKRGGAVVVVRCPSEWKRTLDVWGPLPESIDLMRRVKAKFDPRGLFNPGRFLEGL